MRCFLSPHPYQGSVFTNSETGRNSVERGGAIPNLILVKFGNRRSHELP
jgi:hypothetical protein